MITVLYALFALSAFGPIYTYALYPIILRLFNEREYKKDDRNATTVSVVVVGENASEKVKSIQSSTYPIMEVLTGDYKIANKAKGEIVVFTDTKTELDLVAISEIVKPFADDRVGAVIGQQTNLTGNSAFWIYENFVKRLESRIGCVSGANESLFAVRKSDMPEVPRNVLNMPFYIVTKITENGKDVIYDDDAKAYEEKTEGTNFGKHVQDASGYWQALKLFPQMLIAHHGSFVYVGHRVMKWFVWLNMLMMLVTSGAAWMHGLSVMAVLFIVQVAGYATVIVLGKMNIGGAIGKLVSIGYYFVSLNVSYFLGMFWNRREE